VQQRMEAWPRRHHSTAVNYKRMFTSILCLLDLPNVQYLSFNKEYGKTKVGDFKERQDLVEVRTLSLVIDNTRRGQIITL